MPRPIPGIEDAQTLAQAIVDTIHEPLLVLDSAFNVLAASRSFYEIFKVDPEHTMGRRLYALGDGQWDIPALRVLLEQIIPERVAMNGFEVNHDFPGLGQRVISVAEVQSHLHASGGVDQIEVGPYLTKLCGSLAASMIGDGQPIALKVVADHGMIGSDKAVSIGLIVTELLINAIKYAFPTFKADARVTVTFAAAEDAWTMTVSDNGVGKVDGAPSSGSKHGGLGTVIVDALVKQLDGQMTVTTTDGMTVTIRHAHVGALTPIAA